MPQDSLAVYQLLRPDADGSEHRKSPVVEFFRLHLHLASLVLGHQAKRIKPEVSGLVVLLEVGDAELQGLLDPANCVRRGGSGWVVKALPKLADGPRSRDEA